MQVEFKFFYPMFAQVAEWKFNLLSEQNLLINLTKIKLETKMNKNLKLTLFLLPCSICIYGCTYYKNVPLSPVSESKLSTYAIYKPNVTLEKIEKDFFIANK